MGEVNLWSTLLKGALLSFGMSFGTLLFFLFFTVFWVKTKAKGNIHAFFIEPNKQVAREMIKVQADGTLESKDGGTYKISPDKILWSKWPPALPTWIQEVVPTCFFERNKPEAFVPDAPKSLLTSKGIRNIIDERMLKQTVADARSSAEEGKVKGIPLAMYVALASVGLTIAVTVMGFITLSKVTEIADAAKITPAERVSSP